MAIAEAKAIRLGHPSYVWRRGQDRRMSQIRDYVALEGRRILDEAANPLVERVDTMDGAAQRAAELAAAGV